MDEHDEFVAIITSRRFPIYNHFATIYVKDREKYLIHFNSFYDKYSSHGLIGNEVYVKGHKAFIERTHDISDFKNKDDIYEYSVLDIKTPKDTEFEDILKRFFRVWNSKTDEPYSFIGYNCENLTREIFYNKNESIITNCLAHFVQEMQNKDKIEFHDLLKSIIKWQYTYRNLIYGDKVYPKLSILIKT